MKKTKRNKCKKKCIKFEKEFGSIELTKIVISVMNIILVDAGITTEEEIQDKMIKEIKQIRKHLDP